MKSVRSLSKRSGMFPGGTKSHANPEDEFAELCRQATAKTLERPNADLNQQVVDAVTTDPGNAPSPQFVASTLRARLQLKNPHKVWLSLELIREVMDKCTSITHDDWQDVLVEINRIASKPMNRYASDLPVQQRAKGAAFTLLRHLANEPVDGDVGSPRSPRPHRDSNTFAKQSPRSPNRQAATDGAPPSNAWPRVRQAISNQLALVNSKLETVQEAVLSLSFSSSSSGEGSARADSQQAFLKEVVAEMEGYRSKFEPLLSQLSSFNSPEATQLMSRALETMDVINNIINLQDEVVNAKRSDASSQLAAVAPAAYAPATQPAVMGQPVSSPLDAIAELQQALSGIQLQGPAAATNPATDPFAASTTGSQASNSFSPHSSNNPFKPAPYNPMAGSATSPTHASALSYQSDHLAQRHPYDSLSAEHFGHPGQHQHMGPQTNSSTDSWGGSTEFSHQPHQQQAQAGFNGYPVMTYQGQHQQQPNSSTHQQQFAAAPVHAAHPAAGAAISDAWGMLGARSAGLDNAYPQSQSQPSHTESQYVQPHMHTEHHTASQHGANPFEPAPAAHLAAPQRPAEPALGADWDSLFSRSTSQPAVPASPSAGAAAHAQLHQPEVSHFVSVGPPTQSAPVMPTSQGTSRSAHTHKDAPVADPFDELFSGQLH